jgi:hemerythrin
MALIAWDQSYGVKVKQCDVEHQKLFDLLNSLHDAMRAGKGRAILTQIVAQLHDYTKTHFAAEEALMERAHYPGLPGHHLEHQRFIARVAEFEKDLAAGRGNAVAVLEFLTDWLGKHIKKVDQSYSAHLNASGIH